VDTGYLLILMVKEILKKVPVIGPIAVKIYRRLTAARPFTASGEYWEDRYKMGGNSGAGSYNHLAEFKGEIINKFVSENNIETVIEFGCGDGNQLQYFQFRSYLGYDVSQSAISICTEMYKHDSSKQFRMMNSSGEERADLSLSLDVIYHLIEEEVYLDYMKKLFFSSNKFVIVYSSNSGENENPPVVPHIKHRRFTDWVESYAPDFKMIKHIPNRYPDDGDGIRTTFSDFYIFQKSNDR